jgi:hypothetical protein
MPPPTLGSNTVSAIGAPSMLRAGGLKSSNRSVNTERARSIGASTTICLRTVTALGAQVTGQRCVGRRRPDSGRHGQQEALRLIGDEPAVNCHRGRVPQGAGLQGDVADSLWPPLPTRGASPSRRMTLVGSLRGVPVVDENGRAVEKARLEVLQSLLCS